MSKNVVQRQAGSIPITPLGFFPFFKSQKSEARISFNPDF